jgi:hypothetical protein
MSVLEGDINGSLWYKHPPNLIETYGGECKRKKTWNCIRFCDIKTYDDDYCHRCYTSFEEHAKINKEVKIKIWCTIDCKITKRAFDELAKPFIEKHDDNYLSTCDTGDIQIVGFMFTYNKKTKKTTVWNNSNSAVWNQQFGYEDAYDPIEADYCFLKHIEYFFTHSGKDICEYIIDP